MRRLWNLIRFYFIRTDPDTFCGLPDCEHCLEDLWWKANW